MPVSSASRPGTNHQTKSQQTLPCVVIRGGDDPRSGINAPDRRPYFGARSQNRTLATVTARPFRRWQVRYYSEPMLKMRQIIWDNNRYWSSRPTKSRQPETGVYPTPGVQLTLAGWHAAPQLYLTRSNSASPPPDLPHPAVGVQPRVAECSA